MVYATIRVHAFSIYTQGVNRINKNFHNPKLHQKMFMKIPCWYWGGLIPTDNFLGQGIIKGMTNTVDGPCHIIFLSNFSATRATGRLIDTLEINFRYLVLKVMANVCEQLGPFFIEEYIDNSVAYYE